MSSNKKNQSPDLQLQIKQNKFKSFIRPFGGLTSPRKSSSSMEPIKETIEKSQIISFKDVLKNEEVKIGTTIKIETDEDLHLFIALTKRPSQRAVSKTEKKIKN